ncbi:hypothetical protein KR084_007079 [Drosophila pseudotakahashii]|nr:hypothetical protein KR084_007079 [Drosophila pseudotakahashii]
MGWFGSDDTQSKDNKANVVNDIKIVDHTEDFNALWLLLLILTITSVAQFMLTLYIKHNKLIKKRYISRANDLDRV